MPVLEVAGCEWYYALIVVQTRNDDDDDESARKWCKTEQLDSKTDATTLLLVAWKGQKIVIQFALPFGSVAQW